MKIIRNNDFDKQLKKLNKYPKEHNNFNKIINHIKLCNSYIDLLYNPLSHMYGFSQKKHELSNYYSFNLEKNGGVIRLLLEIDVDNNIVYLIYISTHHYVDFKRSNIFKGGKNG